MKLVLSLFSVLVLSAAAVAHPFYVAVTDIFFSPKDKMLQITHRVFVDDLEAAILDEEGVALHLLDDTEGIASDEVIEGYVANKFFIKLDGEKHPSYYLGHEVEQSENVVYIYMEVVEIKGFTTIGVSNRILMDYQPLQKNIVHITRKDETKTIELDDESFFDFVEF